MQQILKILCYFISLFVIVDGIYVYIMPPFGDEPQALAIIAIGIFIAIFTAYLGRIDGRSDD
jgi:energy-converting hydrogenase Eha subunit A